MKIAFIGQKGIPAKIGGVERYVEELSTRLAENGNEAFVYVRDNYTDKNLKDYKGVKLVHLPSIPTKNLDAISHTFLATVHAIFSDYDVVHYHSIGPATMIPLLKIFKRKTTIVGTYQCQDYFHQKWGWFARTYLKWGEKIISKYPDKTICVSKILQNLVRSKYARETYLVPNGVSIKRTLRNDLLAKWGLKSGRYILTVSRLIRHKGIHYLIEAFENLSRNHKIPEDLKLVIVGDGHYTDDYVKRIKDLAEKNPNIILTGVLSGEELAQIFSNSYLFVQPSESEGMSIALMEAIAYGNPVIASDIPENKEILSDPKFLFKSGDAGELENKMEWVFKNYSEVQNDFRPLAEKMKDAYDWDKIAGRILEIYKDALTLKLKLRKGYEFNR